MKIETKYDIGQTFFLIQNIRTAERLLTSMRGNCTLCGNTKKLVAQGATGQTATVSCPRCKRAEHKTLPYVDVCIAFGEILGIATNTHKHGCHVSYYIEFAGKKINGQYFEEELVAQRRMDDTLVIQSNNEPELVSRVQNYMATNAEVRALAYKLAHNTVLTLPLLIHIYGIPNETKPREVRANWPTKE